VKVRNFFKKILVLIEKYGVQYQYAYSSLIIGFGVYWMLNPMTFTGDEVVVAETYAQPVYAVIGSVLIFGGLVEVYNLAREGIYPHHIIGLTGEDSPRGQTLGSLIAIQGFGLFFLHNAYVFGDWIMGILGAGSTFMLAYVHIKAMEEDRETPYFNKYTHRWMNR
jgi:hypothetical protein